ncbi:response regulator [Defluviimonas sp. SAOS-178_SWC]|uniref:response regulator n=1 Tax=Defluviimonas sp. SAOS-178_SWC TaxID=3121287 RepID=UPI003221931C
MAGTTVLVVEDDAGVRTLLRRCLEGDGFVVREATSKADVLEAIKDGQLGLITLDLNLGSESGIEIARAVRQVSAVPIIMVTGKGDVIDRVVGLEVGADDYISKPFHIREVLARVHSVLRRAHAAPVVAAPATPDERAEEDFAFDGFVARASTMELFNTSGEAVDLTGGDFKLLQVFLEHPRRVLSREQIMDLLNGPGWSPLDRTIDNQVARLRKKIEDVPGDPKLIKTVRGVGYIFTAKVSRQPASPTAPGQQYA